MHSRIGMEYLESVSCAVDNTAVAEAVTLRFRRCFFSDAGGSGHSDRSGVAYSDISSLLLVFHWEREEGLYFLEHEHTLHFLDTGQSPDYRHGKLGKRVQIV